MNRDLIGKVVSPEELLAIYPDGEFYRLTNEEEYHRNLQYKTGINTDILPFNPSGECNPGGMYFFYINQIEEYKSYCPYAFYIRKVSFTPESRIYIEQNKFKTNEFILGDREVFYLEDITKKRYRMLARMLYREKYSKNLSDSD